MSSLLIFGMGYTASHLACRLRSEGWRVTGTKRRAGHDTIQFEDADAVKAALASATHILSSVPPFGTVDPVMVHYADVLRSAPALWIGYISSTGVYGDAGGAWVDESAPVGSGRRTARAEADLAWQALRDDIRIFRLPGIYGPGRSALERVAEGKAHRIALPDQVFSRVHVDDIVSGIIAGFDGPAGVYNLSDDAPCGQNAVIAYAASLLGLAPPPIQTMDEANLSPMARGFYAENRRVANGKAKRLLGWTPAYPDYRTGLRALKAITSPVIVNAAPKIANVDQR
ncbi:SDR family oxidoreductase [Sphingobium boeckii]|uniref:Nucleoside-diphosphate-sugar epimerase n=1 Tax=Sphingobium boeckii TaxID=1082345 RepID=A0A7W9EEQ2_9SPHN|nr:SDR family oxidoreductase [Sphingobium boeckii]MBB5686417.1 nucleoside-diphosphate-sugar epimerase [Sphingobium boeckii]